MTPLSEHPSVKRFRERGGSAATQTATTTLDAGWLRQLCLDAGADDVGFVEIDRPELGDERTDIVRFYPRTRTLISFILRMNREPIRSPARSVANVEFHHTGEHVNEVAHRIVMALGDRGVRATNPAMGFPMEMDRVGKGKLWVVSHKLIAVAAGLGQMGIHRNVGMCSITVAASVVRSRHPCGKACLMAPITSPLTAWPCARLATM